MPPSVTIDAARLHDDLIEEAFHKIVASAAGSASQRARAAGQARLPVKHGGMGLTSMESIRDAAWVGTWALVWKPLRELHEPFRAVDITRESDREFQQLSIFTELQAAHASLMTRYETVAATYAQYDRQVYDYCKEGLAHYRFHPDGLPGRETLLPLAAFDSGSAWEPSAYRVWQRVW